MERSLSKIHKLQWCTIQWRKEQQMKYSRRCKRNFGYVTFENKPLSGYQNKFFTFTGGCLLFEKSLTCRITDMLTALLSFAMIWFSFLSLSDHSHWILTVDVCELFMPLLAPSVCLSRRAGCQSLLSPHNAPFPSLGSATSTLVQIHHFVCDFFPFGISCLLTGPLWARFSRDYDRQLSLYM